MLADASASNAALPPPPPEPRSGKSWGRVRAIAFGNLLLLLLLFFFDVPYILYLSLKEQGKTCTLVGSSFAMRHLKSRQAAYG